ncbi:MAG TPA: SRPBCC family protein [Acidobacteriota bacterium]|nr:SRPBCC family protein [Acidobacteriota bacterium]
MKNFDVQAILIEAPFGKVFHYIADAQNLIEWTSAFKSVSDGRALLETPNGQVEIGLKVSQSFKLGTIDWKMSFPDGSIGVAYSRVLDAGNLGSIYSFVLMPPPLPLEKVEGTLMQQSEVLKEELNRLRLLLTKKS